MSINTLIYMSIYLYILFILKYTYHDIWSHYTMANRWGNNGNSDRLYFLGLQDADAGKDWRQNQTMCNIENLAIAGNPHTSGCVLAELFEERLENERSKSICWVWTIYQAQKWFHLLFIETPDKPHGGVPIFQMRRPRLSQAKLFDCCSVSQLCPTLCDPMNCSTPVFPFLHYLPEFAQLMSTE